MMTHLQLHAVRVVELVRAAMWALHQGEVGALQPFLREYAGSLLEY
jgi:hypothetical protein